MQRGIALPGNCEQCQFLPQEPNGMISRFSPRTCGMEAAFHAMIKRFLFVSLILSAICFPEQVCAQFTDAHNYDNTPVGINQIELSYAYAHGNSSLDTSLIIENAKLNLSQGMISYTRYFSLAKRLAWVSAGLPIAGLNGEVTGTSVRGSVTGTGDSSYQFGALLIGGPALSISQFDNYKPRTILGISLSLTAPTGLYNATKILNLGADRWSFKPEIALSHPFGPQQKWQVDAYANDFFYTDNTSYRGHEILRQGQLPGFEGHISYSLTDKLWISADTRYSFRGTTWVNGVNQDNPQRNFVLGSEMNVTINARQSLLFGFAKILVHHNGPAIVGFAVKYDYTWGGGYK